MKLKRLIPLNDDLFAKLVFLVLVLMIVAIPFSRFLMSVSQFAFGALWLAHGKYIQKIKAFVRNPAAIIITSLYLLHLLGVLWSNDIDYALKDIRIKLPILIIPFMFVGFPKINQKQFSYLVYFFTASVTFVSIYLAVVHYSSSIEIRQILHRDFISHIRYSLSLNLAIFFLLLIRLSVKKRSWIDFIVLANIIWLLWFLFYLKAFTGVIVFFILVFVALTHKAINSNKLYKKVVYFLFILSGFIFITSYLISFSKKYHSIENIDLNNLDKKTASGRLYLHEPELGIENGKYIYIYICNDELRDSWSKRSDKPYTGADGQGQRLKYTLIRYLTSKGLRKDKEGVESLSDQDILNIENGIANIHYTKGIGIKSRLMKIMFEYDNYVRTGDPSGHSVMQRVEYWKTAWNIIEKNFWFGVGTGDLNTAFQEEYDHMNSKLSEEARLRSHNQYLSIWVGLGVIGLLWFLISLFYPALKQNAFSNIYFTLFFITFTVSMLTEDTIESQAGVTFFIYFTCLFLFLFDNKKRAFQNI